MARICGIDSTLWNRLHEKHYHMNPSARLPYSENSLHADPPPLRPAVTRPRPEPVRHPRRGRGAEAGADRLHHPERHRHPAGDGRTAGGQRRHHAKSPDRRQGLLLAMGEGRRPTWRRGALPQPALRHRSGDRPGSGPAGRLRHRRRQRRAIPCGAGGAGRTDAGGRLLETQLAGTGYRAGRHTGLERQAQAAIQRFDAYTAEVAAAIAPPQGPVSVVGYNIAGSYSIGRQASPRHACSKPSASRWRNCRRRWRAR